MKEIKQDEISDMINENVHKLKLRIDFLENGLQEIRKYIENSNADKDLQLKHVWDMTMKISYPEGFKKE